MSMPPRPATSLPGTRRRGTAGSTSMTDRRVAAPAARPICGSGMSSERPTHRDYTDRRLPTCRPRGCNGRHVLAAVAGPEGVDRVSDPDIGSPGPQMPGDLQQAADVAREDGVRAGRQDALGLARAELLGHVG